MNNYIITTLLIVLSLKAYGQSTEYKIQVNTGLFKFSGESAEKTESINYNLDKEDGYTNNPYGRKYGISYGVSANMTNITKSNIRLGIDLGYEILRSRIDINTVWQHSSIINETVSAKGKTNLNSSFLNLFPSIGYLFSNSFYHLYFDGGIDFGYCLNTEEKGYAKSESREYETNRVRKTINLDIRPRIQMGIQNNKIGAYVGYSKGLINYKSGFTGGKNEIYSEMIRFGLTYKLKK